MQNLISNVDFDGTSGAAWPTTTTTWTSTTRGGAATYDIQSNRGRMRTGAAGGYADSALVRADRYLRGPVDIKWQWVVDNPTVNEFFPTMGVGDGTWTGENQTNGIGIDYDWSGSWQPFSMTAGVKTTGTTVVTGHTDGLTINGRMQIKSGSFKFKWWETADEPEAWSSEWNPDIRWEGGFLMIRLTCGAAAVAKEMFLENIQVRSLLPHLPVTSRYGRR